MMTGGRWAMAAALICGSWITAAVGDWTDARCDIYPRGEDKPSKMLPCVFSQRQGAVTITRDDGVTHDLAPVGDTPGNFRDQAGRTVYRQSGLGSLGLIFRFPNESVYVYWDTSALAPSDDDNPTAPFSTRDYDATTLLRCRTQGQSEYGDCPAGILRMDNGQASIVVQSPRGRQFTINFMTDYVNATKGRQVEANREGDTWTVVVDGEETYQIPLAAIEGG